MEKEIADFAVKYGRKIGADFVEARLIESSGNGFLLNNGKMEISAFGEDHGIGIRIIKGNKENFFSTNVLNKDELKKGMINSLKFAKVFPESRFDIELSKEKANKKSYSVKEKIPLSIGTDEKIKIMREFENEIQSQKVKVPSRYISLGDSRVKKYIVNSEGSKIFSDLPNVSFFWFLTVARNGKTMQKYMEHSYCGGYEIFDKEKPIENAVEYVKTMNKTLEKGKKFYDGEVDVVLGPELVGISVHESTGHPYEADRIFGREAAQAGESFVKTDMIGSRIGSDVVTIYDEPAIPNSTGYYLYDDECVKAKRKVLVKNGIINEFLLNRETAARTNTKSNGGARADGYNREALVRMSNSYVAKGDYNDEELFEGIKKGVYIKSYMEWNIDDKRLNQKYVGSEAYEIKNGRVMGLLLNPSIEITTPKYWSSIDAVGNKLKFFAGNCGKGEPMQGMPVSMGGPHVRLRKVKISYG